jgi:rhamnosyltransferase
MPVAHTEYFGMNNGVVAVVVTFNSDLERLVKSLSSLTTQCCVVVVDNSTQSSSREEIRAICAKTGAFLVSLGDNLGIAYAQNVGIAWARQRAVDDILLMDDDSIPTQSLVMDLIEARKTSQLHPVVVSARTVSENGKDLSNRSPENSVGLTPCSELTSSGTLISASIFDRVGVFDERLFIDCVDFEWGWRALALGIPLMLCDSVTIQHRLGEATRLGLRLPSPIRHYYQYRNVVMMLVNSAAPFRWRLLQLIKLPVKLVLILLIADRRFDRLRYMAWGMWDYFTGRTGKFNH